MEHVRHTKNGLQALELKEERVLIRSVQDFLDLAGTLGEECLILKREHLDDSFFDLRSGLAGEVLQKVSNYRMRLGVVGRFEDLESKSLRDFIRECNAKRQVVFRESVDSVLDSLG